MHIATLFKYNFFQYVWLFIGGCYSGYIVETIWCFLRNGFIESRKSLVLGHLSVAYGMGVVLLTMLLVNLQDASWWKIFWVAFLSGTVVEYICSWGQETFFGSVAWDYSNVPFNINGRVCVLYSLFWGVLGIFWAKIMIPCFTKIFDRVQVPHERMIIYAFLAFFIFDCILSASAAVRMNQREAGVAANTRIEQYLDKTYPDEKMRKIYANSKSVDDAV